MSDATVVAPEPLAPLTPPTGERQPPLSPSDVNAANGSSPGDVASPIKLERPVTAAAPRPAVGDRVDAFWAATRLPKGFVHLAMWKDLNKSLAVFCGVNAVGYLLVYGTWSLPCMIISLVMLKMAVVIAYVHRTATVGKLLGTNKSPTVLPAWIGSPSDWYLTAERANAIGETVRAVVNTAVDMAHDVISLNSPAHTFASFAVLAVLQVCFSLMSVAGALWTIAVGLFTAPLVYRKYQTSIDAAAAAAWSKVKALFIAHVLPIWDSKIAPAWNNNVVAKWSFLPKAPISCHGVTGTHGAKAAVAASKAGAKKARKTE